MDRDMGGFMWGMNDNTQTKHSKFLLPSWKTGVIATVCSAVLGLAAYTIYSVNNEPAACFQAVQTALTAREHRVLKDTASLSTYGMNHLPCATGKMKIFVNGKEIGVLPDMKDRLSTDEVHQRYALIQRDVMREFESAKGPQEVTIEEDHPLSTQNDHTVSTVVFSSGNIACAWANAKAFLFGHRVSSSTLWYAPADSKTSLVAKKEQGRTPNLLVGNTNLQTADIH